MQNKTIPTEFNYLKALQQCNAALVEDIATEDAILKSLEISGDVLGAKSVYIYQNVYKDSTLESFQLFKSWLLPSAQIEQLKVDNKSFNWKHFQELYKEFEVGKSCSLNAISINNSGVSNFLRIHKASSSFVIPIFIETSFWGFVGIHSEEPRVWKEIEVAFIQSLVSSFALFLQRQELELKVLSPSSQIGTQFSEVVSKNNGEKNSANQRQIADLKSLAMIAQKSQTVVMLCNADFSLKWVNEAFAKAFEYSPQEVIGKFPIDILSGPETDTKLLHRVERKVSKGISMNCEVLNYSKSGKQIWVLIDITPLTNANNELIGYIIIETDISEKKKAEVEIKETLEKEQKLNTLKTKFVSLASHEFRTPLAGIQLSADIIQLLVGRIQHVDVDVSSKLEKHVNRISSEIFRMTEIMNNVLLMGKIDAERVQFFPTMNDFDFFIKDNLKQSFSNLPNKRQIVYTCDGTPVPSKFDKALMEHIIKNLLSNALKYSEGRQDPELKVSYKNSEIEIIVKDYGIGIPREEQSNIFQSFFRASNTESIQGIGLGMVIIKQFIELHNGTISFESELNKGTTFTINLPISF